MRKLSVWIIIFMLLFSLFVIAKEHDFNPNDSSTWTEQNIRNADFSQVTKEQLDKADSKLLENKVTVDQAKQYFRGRFPITAESQNELILYRKIYPNVDTDSFKNIDRVKLGEGFIETPTGSVNFGQSDVKIRYEGNKLKVGDIELRGGSIKVHDDKHITLGPRTMISTPNLGGVYVAETTEFYTRGNSCTGAVSCVESDVKNRYLKGIALNGNAISVSADDYDKTYDKIQLFKDKSSSLVLEEGISTGKIYREMVFRKFAEGPVSLGRLPFSTDVEIGEVAGTVGIITKDGQIRKSDTTVGKAFAGGVLNEKLRRNTDIYITPDTKVVERYITSDNFEVYRATSGTKKNEILIFDLDKPSLPLYYADGELFVLKKQGIPLIGPDGRVFTNPDGSINLEPIVKFDINQLGPKTRQTLQEAISGRPSNVVPDKDIPTLNQPGIRHRCPPRTRCGGSSEILSDIIPASFEEGGEQAQVDIRYGNVPINAPKKYYYYEDEDGVLHIGNIAPGTLQNNLDIGTGISSSEFQSILTELRNTPVPEEQDGIFRAIPGGKIVKSADDNRLFILVSSSNRLFDASNYRGIPIQLNDNVPLRVGAREFLFEELPEVIVDENGVVRLLHGTLSLGEGSPIRGVAGPKGIVTISPQEKVDSSIDYIKARQGLVEINSIAGESKSFTLALSPTDDEPKYQQIRISPDKSTNNFIRVINEGGDAGTKVVIHTDADINAQDNYFSFAIQNGGNVFDITPNGARFVQANFFNPPLLRDVTDYDASTKLTIEITDAYGNRAQLQIDPKKQYRFGDSIKFDKPLGGQVT